MNQQDQPQQIIGEGRYLTLLRRGRWEYVRRHGASGVVCMIAVTPARELVLVQQHRPALGRDCLELPAGLVGDEDRAEALETAARRELLEETGFEAGRWRYLFDAASSAGMTDEAPAFFLAGDLRRVAPGGGDDSENITVHLAPLDGLAAWLAAKAQTGLAIDVKVYAAPWLIGTYDC
ncbi:MAG: NUDIX hydrolase [Sphingomonadales bacterium]